MTEAEIEALIEQYVLTGGRRTLASGLRMVLRAMAQASVSSEAYPFSSQVWITEDQRIVRMTIDGTNQVKIEDIT